MLCVSLATTTISLGLWAISLTTQVTTMAAGALASAVANRRAIAAAIARTRTRMLIKRKKAVAKAVVRTKAKARLRRGMVAIPLAGIVAAAAFEHNDYKKWKEENPDGNLKDYGCVVGTVSAEVIDDVLQELPQKIRPSRNLVLSRLPDCATKTAVSPDD